MTRTTFAALALLLALIVGCAEKQTSKKDPTKLEEVPESVMKVAKQKLPDVKFDRAWKNEKGAYEIAGKNKAGKTREIDVMPDGTVLEIE